ncbi:MAG: phospholipase D-like domain-containing protein [Luteococcus sp.]|uniref:phospholipase D-like domain-containing protein n=1 Tax=Luteococcus sp. TaxID=1969402 RepID=UPI00264987BF|nr:phospholipase D-like domain-containing protein [Luteococcus sp.]MDN5563898.1 phospholipase D-like domain-containing protein [Luteococcus sp.]
MSRTDAAKRIATRAMATLFTAQVGTAVGLTAVDAVKRRGRRPYRFPVADPTPVQAGPDEVTIYTFGQDLYEAMLADIHRARHSVYLETYIWKGDATGQRFKDALVAAADRGVRVCAIYDEFANLVVPRSFFHFPDNVQIQSHPILGSPALLNPRNTGRDHRKLLVVDSAVAYIGGYNIGDTYSDRWRDTHARLVGPGVPEIENAFIDYWNMRPVGLLGPRRDTTPELVQTARRSWQTRVRVHRNSPRLAVYPIRNMYLEAIDRAAERIWLTQAYLIPDDDLTAALFAAARRGVDVRIIVPAQSNHVVADWLSRGFYEDLLRCGVRLFLYQGAMVHAKTGTIDGYWSTIGTANLDRLSLAGNYEVNAEIHDEAVARRMEEIWAVDEANCVELTYDEWQRRSMVAKFTEGLLAPWRPLF